jgi:hypothetical protein
MLIIEFPQWVKKYKDQEGTWPLEYNGMAEEQNTRSAFIANAMQTDALAHPNFEICKQAVDKCHSTYNYESRIIIGISEKRENFDFLYGTDVENNFRGGLLETKVGDFYIIYGLDFD